MFEKLNEVELKHRELTQRLSDPMVHQDAEVFQKVAREEANLRPIVETYKAYKKTKQDLADNKSLLEEHDESIREMAKEEIPQLEEKLDALTQKLRLHLLPKDPNDDKNIFLEIRAGTGGDEAGLFASDLFRMYSRYAENQGWKVEIVSSSSTGVGGYKEIICLISGDGVYSKLKYESGVHRVQRVPKTESSGRIHTSACTVAVMPEADDVEVNINEQDLRIDVMRSGGAGGQHVNTTDSAVRITHIPSGLVVLCQDEKSQHKNKAKALKVLKARLYDQMLQEQQSAIAADRKLQVGGGDRSEKIRTYNFPQGRVSDHRINLTLYKLDDFMTGDLDSAIEPLITHYQALALKNMDTTK